MPDFIIFSFKNAYAFNIKMQTEEKITKAKAECAKIFHLNIATVNCNLFVTRVKFILGPIKFIRII